MDHKFNWRQPFASAYLRSSGSYLVSKLVIVSLIGLASQYLLTHYLSVENYGLLIWVGTFIALLSPFGLPGISTSITGAVAKGFDGNFRRGTFFEIIGGTIGGLVLIGIGGYYWISGHDAIKSMIFFIGGVFGPGLWLDTHLFFWNGKKDFKAIFWWSVPLRFAQLGGTVIVLLFTADPVWIFAAQTVILVLANFGAVWWITNKGGINDHVCGKFMKYGWISSLLYLLGAVASQLDKFLVGILFGLDKLAIFAVGELIYSYFFKTPKAILDQVFIPRLAEMDLGGASQWIRARQGYVIAGMVVPVLVIAVFLKPLYTLLFSARYDASVFYAYLFMVCIIASTPTLLVGAFIRAHGLKKESIVSQSVVSLSLLFFMPPFAYLWGLKGVIFAHIAQNIFLGAYYYYVIRCYKK